MEHMLFVLLKLFVLAVSYLGYYCYIHEKLRIEVPFLPVYTIGCQITVLFIAGILNLLEIAMYLIWGFGIWLFLQDLHKKRLKQYSVFLSFPYVLMEISMLVLFFCLWNQVITVYDDLAHWAVVVKDMLLNNRLPNFENQITNHGEYLPGSALYIYYFCRVTDSREGMQMLAQAFLCISAVMPLFTMVKKHSISAGVWIFGMLFFLLTVLIPPTQLRVDTLLPLIGMASLFFVQRYCGGGGNVLPAGDRKHIFWALPLFVSTILIKNSGIFFVLIAIVMVYGFGKEETKYKKQSLLLLAASAGVFLLWKHHCSLVFESPEYYRHSISISNYIYQVMQKRPEDIQIILKSMALYSIRNRYALLSAIGMLTVLILLLLYRRDWLKEFLHQAMAVILCYICYMLGMFGMYIFSMPLEEAVVLAGIDRYAGSVLIAAAYFSMWWLLRLYSDLKKKKALAVTFAGMLLLSAFYCSQLVFLKAYGKSLPEKRIWMEQQIKAYQVPEGASYFVFADQSNTGYFWHITKYLLWSEHVRVDYCTQVQDLQYLTNCGYLFLNQPADPILDQWIRENFPEQYGNTVICTGNPVPEIPAWRGYEY